MRLFLARLISRDVRKKISEPVTFTELRKMSELLNATKAMIRVNSHNFYKFVGMLEKTSTPLQHLCDKLRSTCGECDNVCQSTSTDQWCSGVAQLQLHTATQLVSSQIDLPKSLPKKRIKKDPYACQVKIRKIQG